MAGRYFRPSTRVNVLKPHLQATIWTLLRKGSSQREIARVTGIDRKTIRAYAQRFAVGEANSPAVATDPGEQTPPPRPRTPAPTTPSLCEAHHPFIEAQLRLKRNATPIYQDLVDLYAFAGHYNSVKRFVARLKVREPEQFDRLEFAPGEEMQVDYDEGLLTRVPGSSIIDCKKRPPRMKLWLDTLVENSPRLTLRPC